jgi:inner membrane protein
VSAYVIATVGCVVLIGVYLAGVLRSRGSGALFGAGIGLLYGMLFLILRSEDFALLMGTLLLFVALATVMLLTRRVDWSGIAPARATARSAPDRRHNAVQDGGQEAQG